MCQHIRHRLLWAKHYDAVSFTLVLQNVSEGPDTSDTGYNKWTIVIFFPLLWYQRTSVTWQHDRLEQAKSCNTLSFTLKLDNTSEESDTGDNKGSVATHSEHRFPAPSSKLCQIWLRHWRGTLYLRAAVQWRGQRPPKGSGTNMIVEAQARM